MDDDDDFPFIDRIFHDKSSINPFIDGISIYKWMMI